MASEQWSQTPYYVFRLGECGRSPREAGAIEAQCSQRSEDRAPPHGRGVDSGSAAGDEYPAPVDGGGDFREASASHHIGYVGALKASLAWGAKGQDVIAQTPKPVSKLLPTIVRPAALGIHH